MDELRTIMAGGLEKASHFSIRDIINFDYGLPSRYQKENTGRKNGKFQAADIRENNCIKDAPYLIYMKPLDGHFQEAYPGTTEFWAHEDILLKRICGSKDGFALPQNL